MHNHCLNWTPFWISATGFLPRWTVILGAGDARLPWLIGKLPGNKLVPTPEQIYQRVLVEHENHLIEVLVVNRAGAILFWSPSFTASGFRGLLQLTPPTLMRKTGGVLPHLWHTTLVCVPEEVTFKRNGNLRETSLLQVPKQMDRGIKEKAQIFKSQNMVLGNLL